MRIYELIFILKPNLPDDETDALVEQFTKVIEEGGGKVDKVDRWGKRRLAYKVQHEDEGYYVLVQYSLETKHEFSKEIERRLRVSDAVIKYLTIRIDEDLARIAKLKKKREKRAANKPPSSGGEGRQRPRSAPAGPGRPAVTPAPATSQAPAATAEAPATAKPPAAAEAPATAEPPATVEPTAPAASEAPPAPAKPSE
jgi:small subunit ribosomal protein S6